MPISSPAAEAPLCRRALVAAAQHDMTPFREYAHPLVVATDPAGMFIASARPHIDDTVRVTPLGEKNRLPYDYTIEPRRNARNPDPELAERGRRGPTITALTISSPDSAGRRQIAVADEEGHVDIFDAASGKYLHSTVPHPWAVTHLQYFATSAGPALVTAGGNTGRVWDAANGSVWRYLLPLPSGFPHSGSINGVGILPGTSPKLLTASQDGFVKRWSLGNFSVDPNPRLAAPVALRHPGPVLAVQPAPTGEIFATGDVAGFFVYGGGKVPLVRKETGAPVVALQFSRDAERLLYVGSDGRAGVGNSRTGGTNVVIPAEPYGGVSGGYLIRNGQYALTFHETGKVVVWDVRSPNPTQRTAVPIMEYEGKAPVDGLRILARRRPGENTRFVTSDREGNVSVGEIPPLQK